MTVSKSAEKKIRAHLTAAEAIGEKTKEAEDLMEVFSGRREPLTIDGIVSDAVEEIAYFASTTKKKGIYAICDDVVRKIAMGVESYERKRIKNKAKSAKVK